MKLPPPNKGRRVQFELSTEPGSMVYLAGTFNNWNQNENQLQDSPDSGHDKTVLRVPAGTHEYKFIVNGIWTVDPNCADLVPNGFGSLNNVLKV